MSLYAIFSEPSENFLILHIQGTLDNLILIDLISNTSADRKRTGKKIPIGEKNQKTQQQI